jgi:hypothetical protein
MVNEVMEMVEKQYVDNVPLHRHPDARFQLAKEGSCIFVVDHSEFLKMDAKEIQDVFRRRHILVLNVPHKNMYFDRKGLSTIGPFKKKIGMQGEIVCLFLRPFRLLLLLSQLRNSEERRESKTYLDQEVSRTYLSPQSTTASVELSTD